MNKIENFFSELSEYFGSQAKLAKKLGIDPMALSQMKTRKSMRSKHAIKIEELSNGRFKAVEIIALFNNKGAGNSERDANNVFMGRSAILGSLGMRLMFEKILNYGDELLPTKELFLEMIGFQGIKDSLRSEWLHCNKLRSDVEMYLKSLNVDIYNLYNSDLDKSNDQHMYAQMYFTKGFG